MVWIQYKLNSICDMLSITTEIHSDNSTMHMGSLRHSRGFISRKLIFVLKQLILLNKNVFYLSNKVSKLLFSLEGQPFKADEFLVMCDTLLFNSQMYKRGQ